jgi:phospholipase/carboxylesterase
MSTMTDPHSDAPVYQLGPSIEDAAGVVILLHGRGASAQDILSLGAALEADPNQPRLCFLAPQAFDAAWYPQSFLAPRQANQPWLGSALKLIESIVRDVEAQGVGRERIVIGGFSQGACLTTEFAATHPARYAGLIALTGGLIGPPGSDLAHTGDLAGTPALLLAGDPDPHVPFLRVEESATVLRGMGAEVRVERYPGKPHSVSPAEIKLAAELLQTAFL